MNLVYIVDSTLSFLEIDAQIHLLAPTPVCIHRVHRKSEAV